MADYYPLIAKAVSGLGKSEDRRALYDRARTALLAQLRGVEPALSEPDITRERLALEEAIRKVETEAARTATRGSRSDALVARPESRLEQDLHGDGRAIDPPQPVAGSPPRYDLRPSRSAIAPADGDDRSDMEETRQAVPLSAAAAAAKLEAGQAEGPRVRTTRAPVSGGEAPRAERTQWNPAGPSPSNKGLFREAIVETDTSPSAVAAGGKNVRVQTAKDPDFERVESRPSIRTEARREPRVEQDPERPLPRRSSREIPRPPPSTTRQDDGRGRAQSFPRVVGADRALERVPEQPLLSTWNAAPRTTNRIIAIVVMAVLVLTLAGAAYWWGDDIIASIRDASTLTGDTAAPAEGGTRGKIAERAPSAPGPSEGAMVAQKVVLVEEDQANPNGTPFVGSEVWRTERVPPAPGQKPDIVVRAEIEIPEQNVSLRFSLRRNDDKQLPASHTVEIEFRLPPDFVHGGISHIPGIMMKQGETTRGVPLNGVAVKVTSNFFLIGLSSVDIDMERNIQLLKERSWFDIPIVYGDGKRAIIAIEKGTPGERAFTEAFATWGQ